MLHFSIEWAEGEQEWLVKHGKGIAEEDEYGNINSYAIFEDEQIATEYCLRFNRRIVKNKSTYYIDGWNELMEEFSNDVSH